MHILVTGACGYIGSRLVPALLSAGHQVTALDNLMYRQVTLLECFSRNTFDFIKGDVRDKELIRDQLKKVDAIIPLAAIVGAPACARDENLATQVNVDANRMMLDLISSNQIILMPTTNSAYGTTPEGVVCDEEAPLNPISKYASDKVLVESWLLEHSNVVSFRLATVFGLSSRMRLDLLVNNLVFKAFTDKFLVLFEPNFRRNYIHIQDVVDLFTFALDSFDIFRGNIFNVGLTSANLTKLELANAIQKQVPNLQILVSDIGKDPDKRDYLVSNNKLEKTGFVPKHNLDLGIRQLLAAMPLLDHKNFSNL
jgi:nucleoside-diphosphate-sugar epimerase